MISMKESLLSLIEKKTTTLVFLLLKFPQVLTLFYD